MPADSLPRMLARTMNFRLGLPRAFTVSPDGARVVFIRSRSGTARQDALWVLDTRTGAERLIADPVTLLAADEQLTAEELARRQRLRVTGAGVVAYDTDDDVTRVVFALSSQLFVADIDGTDGGPRAVPTPGSVIDPQLDPTGRRVAYADGHRLHVVELHSGADRVVAAPADDEPDEVVWGLAEFIAGEELDRGHGFWWSPDGTKLLVERYDDSPVAMWHISDPAHPEQPPTAVRYPQAGTANAIVGLAVLDLEGRRVDVDWRSDQAVDGADGTDGVVLEYLAHVEWSGPRPVLTLLTRDQRRLEYRELDVETGRTTLLRAVTDDAYVELLPGTPRRLPDGRLLHSVDVGDERRLWLDDAPFTPPDLLVAEVVAVDDTAVIATVVPRLASVALARLGFDGGVELLSNPAGVAAGAFGGGTLVVAQRTADDVAAATTVRTNGTEIPVADVAELPPVTPRVRTSTVGANGLPTTVLFPSDHVPGGRRLPVLLCPYGGPHGQMVVNSARAYLTDQWFADQGFAVVVTDGRGTPGRGPAVERQAKNDRAGTADDQAEAVRAVAELYPDDLDLTRVAVRGWSFGGYLAALCVLRHPDVFAAAIAGAPTTDERLYDTCYSERYLGDPRTDADVYDANSLLPLAADLRRPLMIIHGLADDNVFVAHSLRLSSALLAAGRPHEYLPLTGVTHLASDEVVAENLLLLQLDFLRRALDVPGQRAAVPSV
ncbi:prolyl oligopeptidase family serine peptidase [uncultured Jatrophihabitans sp.]|uniref:S9 family peptidase n=1 Tax=uncultured Jatrophihabitans sp. TaxID=1610747 RepID=UPI0035C9CCD4